MSDSIELFEHEGFIPSDLRPPNVTFKPRRARRINKRAVAIYQNANKRVATESIENLSAKKSMRLGNNRKPSHRLSMRLDDGQGPSRVSSRLNDGLPKDKKSFPSLKERLEIQRERELNIDNDDPQFITFLKYGIRKGKDCNEWSLPRSIGEVRLFNKKLNCSIVIPANRSSTLMVNIPKDLNQWRLKDRIPDERKYVIYKHELNFLIKAPFGVVTAFPDEPNPVFNSPSSYLPSNSSSQTDLNFTTPNSNRSYSTGTTSIGTQTGPENSNFQPDTELTASLWETDFAIAEFEQQNKHLLIELNNLKVSLRCANRSRANAKINADRAESKLEISERVTSGLFDENKEVKQQLEEVTSKAESLQSELLESNKINKLLKKKLDEYDLANKRFQESLNKKAAQIKEQTEIEKLVKQIQVMRVEKDIQRADAIQLIPAVDGQQYEKLERCLHALLTHGEHWDVEQYKKYSVFNIKRGNIKCRLSTVNYPTAYNFDKDPNWTQKCARLPWPIDEKNVPTGKRNWENPSNFQLRNLLITFLADKHSNINLSFEHLNPNL